MTRPRIRTLKPEMWQDEKVGGLSRDARLLFVAIVTLADDDGRFRALPSMILGHAYPYDGDALRKLEGWMRELNDAALITLYAVAGVQYGAIPNWSKHQRINRKAPSLLPPPPGAEAVEEPAADAETAGRGYTKRAIPERVRREVAKRAGAEPGETTDAACHYCGRIGSIHWSRLADGRPGSWVRFSGLEMDHVEPELHGGEATAENVVLACLACNRSKGHGTVAEFRERVSRRAV